MPTNLALDDRLILEAQKLGRHKSKKDAVTRALLEYVRRHKQLEVLSLFGKVEWDASYDHKAARRRA